MRRGDAGRARRARRRLDQRAVRGRWRDDATDVVFVLGSADGLDASIKGRAAATLQLSAMTLPHALARVVLFEQIYRAWSLLNGHPYHRS